MNRLYLVVAALAFLAGSLVWDMWADYVPLTPAPPTRFSAALDEPQRGFLILVRPSAQRCAVVTATGLSVATFECRPTGLRW